MNPKEEIDLLKTKTSALYFAYKNPATPLIAKLFAIMTIGYLLSPIDFIPDFIPVLGYVDDLLILPVLISLSIKFIPKEIMKECIKKAEILGTSASKKWYYGIPIIIIWCIIIFIVLYNLLN